jgi:hypothetical protein
MRRKLSTDSEVFSRAGEMKRKRAEAGVSPAGIIFNADH